MGVTGLWTVLQQCARPVKLETLNKKRLAIDASIWIYQFLKAVRDKEGNALRNSHIVGFFRRICKLLFFGIKPVFVFDGGAPALKKQTILNRKKRREGRRDDAVRTAGKLLALEMQRRAYEETEKRKEEQQGHYRDDDEEEPVSENPVYAEQIHMTQRERDQSQKFKKTDAYHLPNLNVSLENMGAPNDPRIMSQEELEEYARQFHTGEDVSYYDFSKIDFNSTFFLSLPAADRYNILNAARLRSRLRMGYSKDQLDSMFKDRMEFSRFQIERVRERNELTQRLMNINGMNGENAMFGVDGIGRVAGERGREYVLVKNDGVEGGWALGVVSDKSEGKKEKPIDVEAPKTNLMEADDWEDEDVFEDVPIEGLNRLPKRQPTLPLANKKTTTSARPADIEQGDSLFVAEGDDEWEDALFESLTAPEHDEEAEELDRAIAMSLEEQDIEGRLANPLDKFTQSRAEDSRVFSEASGKSIAQFANRQSNQAAPASYRSEAERSNDPMDFQSILTASRRAQHKKQSSFVPPAPPPPKISPGNDASDKQTVGIFGGPLPFERLSLGSSLFGKKAKPPVEPGGFEVSNDGSQPEFDAAQDGKKKEQPPPPWFSGVLKDDLEAQKAIEHKQNDDQISEGNHSPKRKGQLSDMDENGIIDVDMLEDENEPPVTKDNSRPEMIEIDLIDEPAPRTIETNIKSPEPLFVETGPEPEKDDPVPPAESEEEIMASDWSQSDYGDQVKVQDQSAEKVINQVLDEDSPAPSDFEKVLPDPVESLKQVSEIPPEVDTFKSPQADAVAVAAAAADADAFEQQPYDASSPENDYSDPEDEALYAQLAAEADEHARFANSLNASGNLQSAADFDRELKQLRLQQGKDRRDADQVTQIMITECQQLLKLFGLPYITAPLEAEAQCAKLVELRLVDGIVTDDSDVFLFGGTRVYKNMFNQAKFVECYLADDFTKEFNLDRQNLIHIAHLLGSDYTEGLPSVGPVTAVEIVSEFGELTAFREWWMMVQSTPPTKEAAKKEPTPFRRKFRKNAARIFLPPSFPDKRVDEAYLDPKVDSDTSPFSWGVPDLQALREFLMSTIGWSAERTDEVLVPVIRDMNSRAKEGTQSNITNFFSGSVGVGAAPVAGGADSFAPRQRVQKSKRMAGALGKLKQQAEQKKRGGQEDMDDFDFDDVDNEILEVTNEPDDLTSNRPKKKARTAKTRTNPPVEHDVESDWDESDFDEEETVRAINKAKPAKGGRRKTKAKAK
ncbi:MAG: DNA repair protein rad2 [Vezdaea aestivalis]|nr:MAG: DNA repair protein rad2 [Vezdaea aestivalis]